jgi:hypothetical protein
MRAPMGGTTIYNKTISTPRTPMGMQHRRPPPTPSTIPIALNHPYPRIQDTPTFPLHADTRTSDTFPTPADSVPQKSETLHPRP